MSTYKHYLLPRTPLLIGVSVIAQFLKALRSNVYESEVQYLREIIDV